jgi:hypothetical protein
MSWLLRAAASAFVVVLACGGKMSADTLPGGAGSGSPSSGGMRDSGAGIGSPGAGATGASGTGLSPDAGGQSMASCGGPASPGPAPLRRMDAFEYDNTIRDLLGETTRYAEADFPLDARIGGFSNNADAMEGSVVLTAAYLTAAEKIAASAVTRLSSLSACDVATAGADGCAAKFIAAFGKRAFRRPLTADEETAYFTLFKTGSTPPEGTTFTDGISLVIETFLVSPHFLYRVELPLAAQSGAIAALVPPYEMATRLSYFLWGSMPDDALFAAADAGALATQAQVLAQAQRMMQDSRAHGSVAAFHSDWLELQPDVQKDPKTFPSWSSQLALAQYFETQTFLDQVFWGDGHLATLLTAPYTYANQAVTQFYDGSGPMGSIPSPTLAMYSKIMLDPTERAGFLTQGAFLASHANAVRTSPTRRGKFIRERLLCQNAPPPPPDVTLPPPVIDSNASFRDRLSLLVAPPVCQTCHALMDPIGFAFEHYDAVGQWRTKDGSWPIDSSGMLTATDVDGPFDGAVALIKRLSTSADVSDCVATQWFRFATGRIETDADKCTLQSIRQQFSASHQDMRALPVAIATSDAFRYRPAAGASP